MIDTYSKKWNGEVLAIEIFLRKRRELIFFKYEFREKHQISFES